MFSRALDRAGAVDNSGARPLAKPVEVTTLGVVDNFSGAKGGLGVVNTYEGNPFVTDEDVGAILKQIEGAVEDLDK